MEPLSSGQQDRAFISKGYDATSHFETEMDDVLQLYTRITGKQLDLEVSRSIHAITRSCGVSYSVVPVM